MPQPIHTIVIRPSGIWNSRAPLHNYILERSALSKSTTVLTLAIYALRHDALREPNPDRSGRMLLSRVTTAEAVAAHAWLDYRRSFPKGEDGKNPQPSVTQLAGDAIRALYDIREMTIIRLSSLFEAFAQCWAVNALAARLESNQEWSAGERNLAASLLPLRGSGHLPSWPQIAAAFPDVHRGLQSIPHRFNHPTTGAVLESPMSADLNALTAINFWRAYRNLAVHTSRLITRRFHERYARFFDQLMSDLKHIDRLEPGRRMPLHDDLYSAMAAVQYKSALWMNQYLTDLSAGRRGHPEAPGPATTTRFQPSYPIPPLFLVGDHDPSVQWTGDPSFRAATAAREGWKLPNPSLQPTAAGKPAPAAELKR